MTPGPFLAVYCVFNHLIFLDPRPTEGPIKSPLSVSLSARPSVQRFSQKWLITFL